MTPIQLKDLANKTLSDSGENNCDDHANRTPDVNTRDITSYQNYKVALIGR